MKYEVIFFLQSRVIKKRLPRGAERGGLTHNLRNLLIHLFLQIVNEGLRGPPLLTQNSIETSKEMKK